MVRNFLFKIFFLFNLTLFAQSNSIVDSVAVNLEQFYNDLSDSLRLVYNKKLNHMNAYIKLDSVNPEAFLERGICYTLLGMHSKSIEDYTAALELDSTLSFAYFNRGLAKGKFMYSYDACYDMKRSFDLGVEDAWLVLIQECRRYYKLLGLEN